MKKRYFVLIHFGVNCVICGLVFLLLHFNNEYNYYKNIGDSLTIIGILNICIAGLKFVSSQGTFNGLSYAFRNIFRIKLEKLDYHEYIQSKKDSREGKNKFINYLPFLINFTIFIIGSIICLILGD